MSENNSQLVLFTGGGTLVDEAISNVFGITPSKDGKKKRMAVKKRSEIASAFPEVASMTASDKKVFIDAKTLEERDAAKKLILARLMALPEDYTFHSGTEGFSKKGVAEITIKLQQIKRLKPGITDEQMAAKLGKTVAEIKAMREAAEAKEVTVTSTVTPAPELPEPKPEQPDPEPVVDESMSKEEREFNAELEAEKAAAQQQAAAAA